jgi:N6-L-threonylcarbamoyladenine synthase
VSAVILAIDTATEVTAVGIGLRDGDAVDALATCDSVAPRAAMSRLLPCVRDLLAGLHLSMRDVDEVVAGRGPGSFTGVRIGVATAKGIAHGLGAPLFGIGTLDAVAWAVATDATLVGETPVTLGVVGDAMRGEVYPVLFRASAGAVERLSPDQVASPESVAEDWSELEGPLIIAGNGLNKYRELFAAILGDAAQVAPEGLWSPSGTALLAAYVAARRDCALSGGEPGALLPVYTRLSDAEEAERARKSRTPECDVPGSGVCGPDGLGDAT